MYSPDEVVIEQGQFTDYAPQNLTPSPENNSTFITSWSTIASGMNHCKTSPQPTFACHDSTVKLVCGIGTIHPNGL
jgi:hypothetical protein